MQIWEVFQQKSIEMNHVEGSRDLYFSFPCHPSIFDCIQTAPNRPLYIIHVQSLWHSLYTR